MVFDEVAARHRSASTGDAPETAGLATVLASARQRLAALAVRGIRNDPPERYRRLLEDARSEKDRAERALAEQSAEFRDVQSGIRVLLPEVRAALPPGSALVSFVRYEGHRLGGDEPDRTSLGDPVPSYLAFVSTGGESRPALVPLGSAATVESLILQWRRQLDQEAMAAGIGASRSEAAYRRVAGPLRQQIWDPLLPHLANATRVFVVPDGALHLVSLAALPTGSSAYLVETGPTIHYLSAERDLVPMMAGPSLRWIANNAGQEGSVVVAKVQGMGPEEGFNALNGNYENLVHAGVIDPTKVVRSALQNSASIASLLLTTEALVSEIPEEKKQGPMPNAGGMY